MPLRFAGGWVVVTLSIGLSISQGHGFEYGVASGDCTSTSAVVWTKVSEADGLRLEVATEVNFAHIVFNQNLDATEQNDFTVKTIVKHLTPGTTYYYRFVIITDGDSSEIGKFTTAPADDAATSFRFIYTGDSNAADQPFWIFDYMRTEQPDFWFWAGDTIYADDIFNDLPIATDLNGYRAKYVQNRDEFAQALLRESPVWAQWDDHEVADDYDGGDLEPNISRQQQLEAYQAFFEYIPIGDQGAADDPYRTYRSFRYGSLAEFFILDCRQYRSADAGREGGGLDPYAYLLPTYDPAAIARMKDPSRTMLGAEQLAWLKRGLSGSTAKWKFVLSSVPLTSLLYFPYDHWDGYDAERYAILRYIDTSSISGVVFLSADIHGNAYNPDLTHFLRGMRREFSPGFSVPEFIAGPIATKTVVQELRNLGGSVLGLTPQEADSNPLFFLGTSLFVSQVQARNRLEFIEPDRYAYMVVDVTPDGVTYSFKGIPSMPTVSKPALEKLYNVTLPQAQPPMCGMGLTLPFFGMIFFTAATRRPRRGAIHEKGRTAG